MLTVTKVYKIRNKCLFPKFPVSFTCNAGEHIWVSGLNGTGKTTLLEILAGHLSHEGFCSHYDSMLISSSHQSNTLWTLNECVSMFKYLFNSSLGTNEVIEMVGLSSCKNNKLSNLSKGQFQRLNLSQLLLSNKKIWLLDEPNLGLDIYGIDILKKCIKRHLKSGGAVIEANTSWCYDWTASQKVFTQKYNSS